MAVDCAGCNVKCGWWAMGGEGSWWYVEGVGGMLYTMWMVITYVADLPSSALDNDKTGRYFAQRSKIVE